MKTLESGADSLWWRTVHHWLVSSFYRLMRGREWPCRNG